MFSQISQQRIHSVILNNYILKEKYKRDSYLFLHNERKLLLFNKRTTALVLFKAVVSSKPFNIFYEQNVTINAYKDEERDLKIKETTKIPTPETAETSIKTCRYNTSKEIITLTSFRNKNEHKTH